MFVSLPMAVSTHPRVVAGTLCQYYYTVGYLTMAGLAFLLHHSWQLLQIVSFMTIPLLSPSSRS